MGTSFCRDFSRYGGNGSMKFDETLGMVFGFVGFRGQKLENCNWSLIFRATP